MLAGPQLISDLAASQHCWQENFPGQLGNKKMYKLSALRLWGKNKLKLVFCEQEWKVSSVKILKYPYSSLTIFL